MISSRMSNSDNIWEEEEKEELLPGIDEEFQHRLLQAKHQLYYHTIFAPPSGTKEAQNNQLLQRYLTRLNLFHQLALEAQEGVFHDIMVLKFPKGAQRAIKESLDWISNYFSKNQIPDTIPYSNCITQNLHTYQFIQKIM